MNSGFCCLFIVRRWIRNKKTAIHRVHAVATGCAIYRVSDYLCMKYNANSVILIPNRTLTLTDQVTPYFICPLLNKLVKGGRSVAEFVGGALSDLELTLRQFLHVGHNDKLNIVEFLARTFQISTKFTAQFLSNSCLKNGTQKQKLPIWKSRLSSSYTLAPVTVCALDTFSAVALRKQEAWFCLLRSVPGSFSS